ncbi:hypothetical protein OIU77_015920 [Salix suchowensis]|uniref:Ubiquitin carboxyl-terminal hydrolase 15 n=1 Tax=Salix suchowensis TaxID=1278906 RepID=A0ABQ8ZIT2_9ROSI|nr:hypothetical protein OIU77_015920 [Salix suchowensis]
MLEPREADIPVLFLVLVVLPLVAYILLGKWSESAKKRERISLLAQLAAEEACRAEVMATTCVIPPVSSSKNGTQVCARCFSPATTRCSRCKSVRYCSGKCQIIHWRQVHKEECQLLETTGSCSSPSATSCDEFTPERLLINDDMDLFSLRYNSKQPTMDIGPSFNNVHLITSTGASASVNCPATDTSQEAMLHRRSTNKQVSCKSNKEINHASSSSMNAGKYGTNAHEIGTNITDFSNAEASFNGEMTGPKCSYETPVMNENVKANSASHPMGNKSSKSSKSKMKVPGNQSYSEIDGKGQLTDESKVARMSNANPAPGSNGATSIDIMKMMGLRKSAKLARQDTAENNIVHKTTRMLFPYEEFVKIFNCEVINLTPRGLVNCGNSCYANAVLQCLTCTKPLIIFLLHRSHSRACCGKDWCLMCELEQHVMMLRECGGPLSPSRILLHMRKINCQIGDGSQEDAHEFLRLLIASMQSICLERLGGEDNVDPRLQETTFIQHTFGGRLRSKVKCDVPPLYMLYAVVVHLDTLNASFSGHYVAYVKDLRGSWFKIDDTEVHPVSMSQVMLEGAYILFYKRSSTRPQKLSREKPIRQQVTVSSRHRTSRTQKPSRQGQSKCSSHCVGPEVSWDIKPENGSVPANYANGIPRRCAGKNITQVMDFSDATSSDRSIFTSSDEASFTTESTRDSFSTIDYADACNADAFSSIFNDLYPPESSNRNTLCRRTFSYSRPQTRFISETGNVLDSYSTQSSGHEKERNPNRYVIHQPTSLRAVPAPCL